MTYARSAYGAGNIGALTSGIGLTMGPTIGSTDQGSAMALGGLGALSLRSQIQRIGLQTPTIGFVKPVSNVISRVPTTMVADTNYVSTTPEDSGEPLVDETLYDGTVINPESSGVSPWVWVVGGILGLGLIGGLAWWALK